MYPSAEFPAYGIFVQNFVKNLKENNIEVKKAVKFKQPNKWLNFFSYLFFFAKTKWKVFFEKYDLIYIHYADHSLYSFFSLQYFTNKKIVINFHGSDFMKPSKLNSLVQNVIHKAQLLVVPSLYFKGEVMKKYPNSNYFISPSGGVDTNLFKPLNIIKDIRKFSIGFVGRIDDGKGWKLLLYVFSELAVNHSNIKLEIVGNGSQFKELNDLVERLNLQSKVILHGSVPHQNLVNFYNNFDIMVFPSQLNESLGLVGIEAMSCGIPVIGSKIGGLNDYLVDNLNGKFFEVGNKNELKNCIVYFMNLEFDSFKLYKENARKTALNFDSKKVGDELINKLKTLVS